MLQQLGQLGVPIGEVSRPQAFGQDLPGHRKHLWIMITHIGHW
jgi:hypothetical protein